MVTEDSKKNIRWGERELSSFKRRVMRRVYFTWFLRKVLIPAFVVLPLSAFLLVRQLADITVQNIAETTLLKLSEYNFLGLLKYFIAAIRFAELDMLLIVSSSLLLAAFFGRRLIRDVYFLWFGGAPLGVSRAFRRP